jgi:putative ABC transport system permease protein
VVGTFEDLNFGKYVISQRTFTNYQNRDSADVGLVALAEGVSPDQGRTAVADALDSFPVVEISTASEAIVQAEAQVDQLVALFYGLLGLAILIAMIGIANTLTLSVAERTREIGLLRAVGLSRAKTSAMVRWEAAMIGIFGAILGVVVGTGLGWAAVTSLSDDGLSTLSLPWSQLGAWIVLGGVAAVAASFGPARKAARLNVLEAIAHQ